MQYIVTVSLKDVPDGVSVQDVAQLLASTIQATTGQSVHINITDNDAPGQWDRGTIATQIRKGVHLPGIVPTSLEDLPKDRITPLRRK